MQTAVFSDPVSVVVAHLADHLDVPVVSAVPDDRPEVFVLVQLHGGARGSVVSDRPRVGIEAWAGSWTVARDLAQIARAHVHAMPHHPHEVTVYRVREVTAPYDDPDPDSSSARCSQEQQLHLRGGVLHAGS